LGFSQQDAIGHKLYVSTFWRPILEPNFITDYLTQVLPQLFGNSVGHCGGGNPAGLGAADDTIDSSAGGQTKFRQLGGFAGAGLAGNHDNLLFGDGPDDLVFFGEYRQILIKPQWRPVFPATVSFLFRGFQSRVQPIESLLADLF
jgi:hypothetical protein